MDGTVYLVPYRWVPPFRGYLPPFPFRRFDRSLSICFSSDGGGRRERPIGNRRTGRRGPRTQRRPPRLPRPPPLDPISSSTFSVATTSSWTGVLRRARGVPAAATLWSGAICGRWPSDGEIARLGLNGSRVSCVFSWCSIECGAASFDFPNFLPPQRSLMCRYRFFTLLKAEQKGLRVVGVD